MDTLELSVGTLYSGSKGNCTWIACGGDLVLIDAGRSAKSLCDGLRAVGLDIARVRAIFITHEHSDHIGALEMLSKKYDIPIHMAAPSAEKLLPTTVYLQKNIILHPPLFSERVGGMTVSSFCTPHDSEMSVGYRIELADGRRIGYATDIGHITDEISDGLAGAFAVVLESNHDPEMLQNGRYPLWLKARIASPRGHLSNTDCAAFLPRLAAGGTAHVLLAHLSAENNRPALALRTAQAACPALHILVAKEGEPTRLL
ncbi:MAG: MBL fold metallo-hydrolase [Clostridia bacterium]|nr:MBL fold metallo-hydrolase [Clostridia bacterium]